ncbi:MAG TPA: hypothetical protein VFG77_01090 [Nitrososphaeraceae archaeon]|nr:hypothetical protein [Nitrososphaeraceae archaeon]
MAKINMLKLVAITIMAVALTVLTPIMNGTLVTSTLAQEEEESSGDLTEPEDNAPFGGDNAGTFSIGPDRYGLRVQVDMSDSPTNGTVYVAWLVDNSTGDDIGIGQLVDDELAATQEITNSSSYNLIEVTEEAAEAVGTSRNQSAIVAGAELEGEPSD